MTNKSSSGVQSVERLFGLLELIAARGSSTVSDLSSAAGLPMPTTHRLLNTGASLGYVRQLPDRRYGLGAGLIRLGETANQQIGALCKPRLRTLADSLGETSNMAVLQSDMVIFIAQAEPNRSMRMFTRVGQQVHVHCTGVGKAILAQLPEKTVRGILNRSGMPRATERSISNADHLLGELEKTRRRGYAIDDQEQELGVRCLALAVPDAPVPTAISVSGPASRLSEAFAARAVPLLKETGLSVSVELRSSQELQA